MGGERSDYRQRRLFEQDERLRWTKAEDHWFDRKSSRISAEKLANLMVGFANADGGTIVVGIADDGQVEGVDRDPARQNQLRNAAIDFTEPPVRHTAEILPCTGPAGLASAVLLFEVHPSEQVHKNHRGEVYCRFGDQNRRLDSDAVRELLYDKGQGVFDGTVAADASVADLDQTALATFAAEIGVGGDIARALRVRGLTVERDGQQRPTWAAVLLFSGHPEQFLPGAFVRVLRYQGISPIPGTQANLILDRRICGSLPEQIAHAESLVRDQLRNVTRLDGRTGRFETVPELPRFAWLEAIVNAVTHRSYSRQGDHIRVKLFDDRFEVESPGRLPGPVRIDNIRHTRFSRNPRISRVLADLRLVQELNEGINRMYVEMTAADLPEPEFHQTDAGFRVRLFTNHQRELELKREMAAAVPDSLLPAIDKLFADGRIATRDAARLAGITVPTARNHLHTLARAGWIRRVATATTDPGAYWQLVSRVRRD